MTRKEEREWAWFDGQFRRHYSTMLRLTARQPVSYTHLYYVSTVGLQEKALRKYIQEQEKQDQIEDKVSTKEYENPFKGQAR